MREPELTITNGPYQHQNGSLKANWIQIYIEMSCVLYTQIVFYKHHCWAHTVKIILNRIANLYLFEWYVKMQTLLSQNS